MGESGDFERRYADLQAQYVERTRERLEEVEALVEQLGGPRETERLEELRQIVHRLAGSGETMGFEEVSELSIPVEDWLEGVIEGELPEDVQGRLLRYVEQVREAL